MEQLKIVYADWLLKVGNGSANSTDSEIKLDPTMKCGDTIESLFSAIYPGLDLIDPTVNNDQWFLNRTILCPRNDAVCYEERYEHLLPNSIHFPFITFT